jgi:hypothetical protein
MTGAAFGLAGTACLLLAGCGTRAAGPSVDGGELPGQPDLVINGPRMAIEMSVESRFFRLEDCALDPAEACVAAPGDRRLLRFAMEVSNLGTADLHIGAPDDDDEFPYSSCHEHRHYADFIEYRLEDLGGRTAALGRKQAFCLMDVQAHGDQVAGEPIYDCDDQGIQRGWSDIYPADVPCQWLDVTDLPDGDYRLVADVNPEGSLEETNLTNNRAEVEVTLGDSALERPTEPCPGGIDDYTAGSARRECGWSAAGRMSCQPETVLAIRCAGEGDSACSGRPFIRACRAGEDNCSVAVSLGIDTGRSCPRVGGVRCPSSGELDLYVTPEHPAQPYHCELVADTGS